MMAESHERKKEEQENECVICLDRPMSTVLQPCGHVQMCSRCCRELLALAGSKSVEPQVREKTPVPSLILTASLGVAQCPTCREPVEDVMWLDN